MFVPQNAAAVRTRDFDLLNLNDGLACGMNQFLTLPQSLNEALLRIRDLDKLIPLNVF